MPKLRVLIGLSILACFCGSFVQAASRVKPSLRRKKSSGVKHVAAKKHIALAVTSTTLAKPVNVPRAVPSKSSVRRTSTHRSSPWRAPNFADSAAGDITSGDDPIARQAALDGLGKLNGAVVITDAATGRILTMVNQKLALSSGFIPCSTIKVPVALAALSESVVDRDTKVRLYGRTSVTMTEALAKSNNQYFASLGEKLGFDRMSYYARLFGLGEKAGLDIEDEQAGILPDETPKTGMGMMTSFGDGITLTPLEFAGLLGAVANGGTLFYLQYPKSPDEALLPRVKRHLEIGTLIPEIKPGMAGAVEYGTARRIGPDVNEQIFGKTGTCTDARTPTHMGWFGSFAESNGRKVVVVVMLTGGSMMSGPAAAGVAGNVYKNLDATNFFAQAQPATAQLAPAPTAEVRNVAHFGLSGPLDALK